MHRAAFGLLFLVLSGQAATSPAQTPAPEAPACWAGPTTADPPRASSPWRRFVDRHPQWRVRFDPRTGQPVCAFGPGIPSFLPSAGEEEVRVAARDWRDRLAPALGHRAADHEFSSVMRAGRLWTVHFRQRHRGLPVLDCGLSLRFDARGRLVFWGGRSLRCDHLDVTDPLTPAEAMARARIWHELEGRIAHGDTLETRPPVPVIWPRLRGERVVPVFCWRVRQARTSPPSNWVTLLDARTGERHAWWDEVRTCRFCAGPDHLPANVTGVVQGTTHDGLSPRANPQLTPLRDIGLTIDGVPVVTGTNGSFSWSGGGSTVSLQADLDGPYVDVVNMAGSQASLATTVGSGPTTLTFDDGNSTIAERDVAFFVNRTHAFQKLRAPGITVLDTPLVARVGHTFATCNAFYYPWDDTINFVAAAGSCADSATSATIVHHEVGHALTTRLWALAGRQVPPHIGEGFSDVVAATTEDVPSVGADLVYPGDPGRTLNNSCTWPASCGGGSHAQGRVYGGGYWDARLLFVGRYGPAGKDLLDDLFFEHLVAAPLTETDSVLELLLLDDDDGDLSNGTPHLAELHQAFTANHGIPFPLEIVGVDHEPLRDTGDALQPYRIEARLTSLLASPPSSCDVVWSVDGGPSIVTPMSPGPGGVWAGAIPVQAAGAWIRYHLEARSAAGDLTVRPPGAPTERYEFLAGAREIRLQSSFETAGGWGVEAGSVASSWERGIPTGPNPLEPTTAFDGVAIWGTDIGLLPLADGYYDASESSALLSPPIDLTGLTTARLAFRRWLRVAGGGIVRAAVEMRTATGPWMTLWENSSSAANGGWVSDFDWNLQVLPVPSAVLGAPAARLRFVLQSNSAAVTSGGWNLDALRIEGVPALPLLTSGGSTQPGQVWTLGINAPAGTPYLALADVAVPSSLFLSGLGTMSVSAFSPTVVVLQDVALLPPVVGTTGTDALALTVPTQPWLSGLSLGFQAVMLPGYDPERATISNFVTLDF